MTARAPFWPPFSSRSGSLKPAPQRSCAAAPKGVNSLDGGVAAEFEPTCRHTLLRSVPRCHLGCKLQVEGAELPSICELPPGSAPGEYHMPPF